MIEKLCKLRAWRLACAISAGLALGACSTLHGGPESGSGQTLASLDSFYSEHVRRSFAAQTEAERVSIRNEYITVRMAVVDRNYHAYRQDLYAQRVGSDVGFDLAALGLTATSAATSSVTAKTNLSALAAALIGAKASIDKNVYFDRTLPAMLSQMDASRAEVRAQLFVGIQLPTSRYSLAEADSQLSSYLDAGSLTSAVKSLTNQAAQQDIRAIETLRNRLPSEAEITAQLKSRGFVVSSVATTPAAMSVQSCVRSDGTLAPEVQPALRRWFDTAQPRWAAAVKPPLAPSPTPFNDFLAAAEYEPLRQQALADTTLGPLIARCANR